MTPIGFLKRLLGRGRQPPPDWRVQGRRPRGAWTGVDFSEAWTLPQGGVAFLRSAGPREALFAWRPWGSPDVPVSAGALYRFSALAAVHRCRAELVISLKDETGRVVDEQRRGVSSAAKGGRERAAYDHVVAEFRAPGGVARAAVAFRKGGAEPGQDSFLFVAEPRFAPVDEAEAPPPPPRSDTRPAAPVAWPSHRAAEAWNHRRDAEARSLAAHAAWLRRAARGEAIPDLAGLEAALAGEGEVPQVDFPRAEAPHATVLIDEGDDPGRLALSLAALRFAANDADFELRVVERGGAAGALAEARTDRVVLMEPGWEPVAGWLDELIAAADAFDVPAVAPRLLDEQGRLAGGGNPHHPRVGFARPVGSAFPLMIDHRRATNATTAATGATTAATSATIARLAHLSLAAAGLQILSVPTAEFRRLGADPEPPDLPAVLVRPPAFRVLFIDQEAPTPDMDAGGYAAFQEMRMLQALGAKVDFLPKNLAWMDRHTLALQRAGIECHHTPFARHFDQFLQEKSNNYDVIFVMRYKIAVLVQQALEGVESRPKLVLNLADLHFLRELRDAAAGTPGFDLERARATQAAELAAIEAADLTLTYSDVEAAAVAHHTGAPEKVALAPWTVEARPAPIASFADTKGLMFLGGFGHPPNAQAVIGFVNDVMPLLASELAEARLRVVGSKPTPEVLALAGPSVEVLGYVPDLDEVFAHTRIFVAPLVSGAGLKGKVIEALARGVPMVLTPIAAEGTGLVDDEHCLIARGPEEQAAAITRLYTDEALWTRLADASLAFARERFGFHGAVEALRAAMARIGIETPTEHELHYRRGLPDRNRGASSAPAVMRLP